MDFVSNNKNYDSNLTQKSQSMDLFKFELNRSQSIIVLIFALTGLFLMPVLLGGEIIFNLFNSLFRYLPAHLSDSEHYSDFYLVYNFVPNIGNLIIYSLFFYISFMAVRKILRGLGGEGSQKSKIIPQERIVRWFGLKISHGQAIFIFSLSIVGIPFFTFQITNFIMQTIGTDYPLLDMFYYNLLSVRTDQNSFSSHEVLLNNAPLIINGVFLVLFLYSIFVARRNKKSHSNELKTTSNLGIFVFFSSFLIFLLFLLKLFVHLFLFIDLAFSVGKTPRSINIYQVSDFLKVIIVLIVSLAFLISSYFLKKRKKIIHKDQKENLTWFHVKLTKNRYIMLLSYNIMYTCLLVFLFAVIYFPSGSWMFYNGVFFFFLIFFLLILYSFIKIRNKDTFQRILDQFNDSEDFKTNWFKFKLNRLQSVVICSISSGAMIFYIFEIVTFRASFQFGLTNLDVLWVVQLISMVAFSSILLLFVFYSIKCTYKAVKSQ